MQKKRLDLQQIKR